MFRGLIRWMLVVLLLVPLSEASSQVVIEPNCSIDIHGANWPHFSGDGRYLVFAQPTGNKFPGPGPRTRTRIFNIEEDPPVEIAAEKQLYQPKYISSRWVIDYANPKYFEQPPYGYRVWDLSDQELTSPKLALEDPEPYRYEGVTPTEGWFVAYRVEEGSNVVTLRAWNLKSDVLQVDEYAAIPEVSRRIVGLDACLFAQDGHRLIGLSKGVLTLWDLGDLDEGGLVLSKGGEVTEVRAVADPSAPRTVSARKNARWIYWTESGSDHYLLDLSASPLIDAHQSVIGQIHEFDGRLLLESHDEHYWVTDMSKIPTESRKLCPIEKFTRVWPRILPGNKWLLTVTYPATDFLGLNGFQASLHSMEDFADRIFLANQTIEFGSTGRGEVTHWSYQYSPDGRWLVGLPGWQRGPSGMGLRYWDLRETPNPEGLGPIEGMRGKARSWGAPTPRLLIVVDSENRAYSINLDTDVRPRASEFFHDLEAKSQLKFVADPTSRRFMLHSETAHIWDVSSFRNE